MSTSNGAPCAQSNPVDQLLALSARFADSAGHEPTEKNWRGAIQRARTDCGNLSIEAVHACAAAGVQFPDWGARIEAAKVACLSMLDALAEFRRQLRACPDDEARVELFERVLARPAIAASIANRNLAEVQAELRGIEHRRGKATEQAEAGSSMKIPIGAPMPAESGPPIVKDETDNSTPPGDGQTDTRNGQPEIPKKKRPMNPDCWECARAYKKAQCENTELTLKDFVKSWAFKKEREGEPVSESAVYRTLTDNRKAWEDAA